MKAQPAETRVIDARGVSTAAGAARTRGARYTRSYLAHAAIANVVFDALDVRVRDLPITAERIVAAAG